MSQNQNEKEITIRDQMKKFLIKGFYGFNTILSSGLGRRLGIFDYLDKKAKKLSESGPVSSISFTPEEITKELKLDPDYLDAWIHLSLECGIFEIENAQQRTIKTAPHVYDLLINRNHMFYVGDTIGLFYYFAPVQDDVIELFKTGKTLNIDDIYEEMIIDGHRSSARCGVLVEGLFSKHFKDFSKIIRRQGKVLAVGCGYGFNMEKWAEKYKKTRFVGIDIDSKAIEFAKKLIEQHNWNDRIKVFKITINEYAKKSKEKYDLILLNQVLHEMDHDEEYRRSVFEDLHTLLKDEGVLLVGETMIPDTFSPKKGFQLFDIMHKFLEVKFAKFYDEKSFKEFIDLTPFKHAELIKERGNYFWAIRK
ncbi:MAG: class I SAM-dependent methyltransferase [Candidatus Lokiarchaeota archaeon]|nr:class I SAM-dependent methyltransferase [Candidatus Lokiarchaeota archaeon]